MSMHQGCGRQVHVTWVKGGAGQAGKGSDFAVVQGSGGGLRHMKSATMCGGFFPQLFKLCILNVTNIMLKEERDLHTTEHFGPLISLHQICYL